MESASRDPTFINLDSTNSEEELVVESSLGCTTDCSTSEDRRRGLVNVTSENDQFQVLFEPAATCTASTRSDEIPENFIHQGHTDITREFVQRKKDYRYDIFNKVAFILSICYIFSKSAIMCVCTISLSITLNSWSGPRFNLRRSFFENIFGGIPPDPLVLACFACWLCFAQYQYLKYFIYVIASSRTAYIPNHQLLPLPLTMVWTN